MARRPKPWERKGRGFFVQLHGKQVALGRNKKLAYQRYHELMAHPEPVPATSSANAPFVIACDDFLEWTRVNRAERTFDWYLERLQSFTDYLGTVDKSLPVGQVKPL